ncbi:hypothetical protein GGI00_003585 [Coemansia sp. RSA 2681]|nr:hypothetical protein GGI00_003585 [Coemansia sp. RSA 2681]
MSQYQPPPLDSYGPQGAASSALQSRNTPSLEPSTQRPPLLNPFGSPHSPPRIGDAGQADLEPQKQARADDRPVVAFVGGIASEMDDKYVLEMLRACGKVNSWRRAFDSDDRPLPFGFCEFKGLKGVICAKNVLPKAAWDSHGERVLPLSQPKPPTVTVDKSIQWTLDSCQYLDADRAAEQAALSAVKRIIQESRAITSLEIDEQLVDKGSTEAEASTNLPIGIDAGHDRDRGAELNLNSLSITKEAASRDIANAGDERHFEPPEQQPFILAIEDEWEREQARSHRARRYILAASEREDFLSKEQEERERRAEHAALRELERVEERQRARDLMSEMLSKWDDSEEERLREHEYYRDRERWWHRRKAARTRELELDAIDRQDQALSQSERRLDPHTSAVGPTDGTQVTSDVLLADQPAPAPSTSVCDSGTSEIFARSVAWGCVDESLLHTKVEPTARRLLQEYIGGDADQEVADLAEFVIGHIRDRKSPQSLVEELEMVLVEEAREFVGQLWSVLPSV